MLRRFSINFALFSMLLDGLSVALSLRAAVTLRPTLSGLSFIEPIQAPLAVPAELYVLFPLAWMLVYLAVSIYDGKKYLRVVDEFAALSLAMFIASISAAGILYLSFREVSRALFILFVGLAYCAALAWRVLARLYFRVQKDAPLRARRVLVVGAGPLGQRIEVQIKRAAESNLSLVGFVDDRAGDGPLLGGTHDFNRIIAEKQVTDVVMALPHSAYNELGDLVQRLNDLPVQIWVALGFFDLALYRTAIEDFAGIPMLDLRASAIDDYQRMLKRVFDLSLGGLMLVLASPLMGLAALAILLEDGRPVIFRQKRVGENGRVFDMLKFRTMVRNAEELRGQVEKQDENGNLIHKTKNDPRVTRVGRVLRRLSLDELPQLFNIIGGTMSLVGPRPEMTYLVEKYQPWQRKRFAVPPGLTGWWQVNGRSDLPMHLHTEFDLYYIQNYSIWLDIQILVRTVWVVLIGRGSY
ncbi:MAG TPA: sugar transferase [Anaerolineales bacterium]|jgi:exopolysaccharide biosynthesis polyprenyl glycosylphosphotransferase